MIQPSALDLETPGNPQKSEHKIERRRWVSGNTRIQHPSFVNEKVPGEIIKDVRENEVEEGPEFAQVVLQRGACGWGDRRF